jgi:AcrR family transcriptional regulator
LASSVKDKKTKILDAAIKLFTRQGYHETKLDEVAKQAEIAKGTLYLYYKSKEDLFLQCLIDGFEKSMVQTKTVIESNDSTSNRLLKLLELQAELHRHNGPLIQQFIQSGITISSTAGAPKRFFNMMKEKVELVAVFFEECVKNGEFTDRFTPVQMALIYHQIFDLNLKFQMFQAPTISPERCSEMLFDLFKSKEQAKA